MSFSFYCMVSIETVLPSTSSTALSLTHTPKHNNSYYAQRAKAGGLLISEATNICPGAQGEF